MIPKTLEVKFLIPAVGPLTQTYNCFCPADLASWRGNCKLTAAVQLSVKILESVEDNEKNRRLREKAENEAKKLFEIMKREKK